MTHQKRRPSFFLQLQPQVEPEQLLQRRVLRGRRYRRRQIRGGGAAEPDDEPAEEGVLHREGTHVLRTGLRRRPQASQRRVQGIRAGEMIVQLTGTQSYRCYFGVNCTMLKFLSFLVGPTLSRGILKPL